MPKSSSPMMKRIVAASVIAAIPLFASTLCNAGNGGVTVTVNGSGTVTSNPTGINCGVTCDGSFDDGTDVMLIASPSAGAMFEGWTGACDGSGVCSMTIAGASDIGATFSSFGVASDASNDWVQKAYVAYYGRAADPAGMAYWASRLDAEGGDLASIIASFGTSDEFDRRYGNLSNSDLIDALYQQLLARAPDDAGKQWYLDQLDNGNTTPQVIALDLIGGVQGDDVQTVANRLDVANYYTGKVAAGCDYGTEESGVAELALVTSDAATVDATKLDIEGQCPSNPAGMSAKRAP